MSVSCSAVTGTQWHTPSPTLLAAGSSDGNSSCYPSPPTFFFLFSAWAEEATRTAESRPVPRPAERQALGSLEGPKGNPRGKEGWRSRPHPHERERLHTSWSWVTLEELPPQRRGDHRVRLWQPQLWRVSHNCPSGRSTPSIPADSWSHYYPHCVLLNLPSGVLISSHDPGFKHNSFLFTNLILILQKGSYQSWHKRRKSFKKTSVAFLT